MPIPTYTPGYPPDGSSLGQTKSTLRNNLDGTFDTIGIDHVNNNGQPGSQPAGYHTVVHQVSQTSVSTVSGYNQIFSGVPGTLVVNSITTAAIPSGGDTQLYSLSGAGVLSQLTGSSRTTNGYVWVGGLLFQWGFVMNPGSSGTVSFNSPNVNFPNNCFNVQLTLRRDGSSSAASIYVNGLQGTSSFNYAGDTAGSTGLFWTAIGN